MTTIDYLKNISVDSNLGQNELVTLGFLTDGLNQLNTMVDSFEAPLRQKHDAEKSNVFMFGNHPDMPPGALAMLPCYFHWYGVSILNYARLVGFLDGLKSGVFDRKYVEDQSQFKGVATHCDSYVDSITELAPLKVWRNKVAAHFAITDPRKSDNPAFLDFSVMYPVAYDRGRFKVGTLQYSKADSSGSVHTGSLPEWSLTEIHQALSKRFWGL